MRDFLGGAGGQPSYKAKQDHVLNRDANWIWTVSRSLHNFSTIWLVVEREKTVCNKRVSTVFFPPLIKGKLVNESLIVDC